MTRCLQHCGCCWHQLKASAQTQPLQTSDGLASPKKSSGFGRWAHMFCG